MTTEICDIIDDMDRDAGSSLDTGYSQSGEYQTRTRKGVKATAGAFKASAECSVLDASFEAATASADAHYGADGAHASADATLVRAQARAGPVKVGVGLQFKTGIGASPDGVHAELLGFGVSVGSKMKVQTPIADVECVIQ